MNHMFSLSKRLLTALLCASLLLLAVGPTALAAGVLDPSRSASLSIHYRSGDQRLAGVSFSVYKVATVSSSLHFTLASPFEDAPVSLDRLLDQGEWQEIALTLQNHISNNSIAPTASVITDENGEGSLASLSSGLYLVSGTSCELDWKIYTPETALILLPNAAAEGGWLYDVKMYPKPEIETIERLSRQVIKVWNDQSNTALRPEQLTVQLMRGEEVFDTVALSALNGWAYRWNDLDSRYQWSVREPDVPVGYSAKVTQAGDRFIITNTLSGTESSKPDDTLPQTGLTWWPVPVLAAAGMGLFLTGWLKQRRDDS